MRLAYQSRITFIIRDCRRLPNITVAILCPAPARTLNEYFSRTKWHTSRRIIWAMQMARKLMRTEPCVLLRNIIFFPLALASFVYNDIKSQRQAKKRRLKREQPPIWPLPYPVLDLTRVDISSQCTNLQSSCGLFKLPVELRLIIYNYIFGAGDLIRITKILYRDEPPPRYELCMAKRWYNTAKNENAARVQQRVLGPNFNILGLLLTCRMLWVISYSIHTAAASVATQL
jgi:hypothetical protein